MDSLVGVGLYTPAEAGRLLRIRPSKIVRWLRGHDVAGKHYEALWSPEIRLGDDRVFLSFRDLMEVRVADAFIKAGVSAVRVRKAILVARDEIGQSHPLSTNRFRTDGREIFLQIIEKDERGRERARLLNLFRKQFEFKSIIDPLLRTVEFDDSGNPLLWWPTGRKGRVVVDPARAFGQPIDSETSVPTSILANNAKVEGPKITARIFKVPVAAVHDAIEYEETLLHRKAA